MSRLRTYREQDVDLANPDPATILIEDIACHLSRINRFLGATRLPLSVAQHCCYCARVSAQAFKAPPLLQLIVLLHDAAEAYTGDITRPLRRAMKSDLGVIETKLDAAVAKAFGLPLAGDWPQGYAAVVRASDDMALAAEWRDLMTGPLDLVSPAAPFPVKPQSATQAENEFLKTFHRLTLEAGVKSFQRNPPTGIFK